MSENTKDKKVVVVANLKSPVIGFVVAWLLGWFGVDRFYKGGILSILLGIVKLILGLFAAFIFFTDGGALVALSYVVWYLLDFILVPLGISLDNRRKLAMAGNDNAGRFINKADIVALVIAICVIFAPIIIPAILSQALNTREDAKVMTAKSDIASAQKAIVANIYGNEINTKSTKAPNPTNPKHSKVEWGEWIMYISGLDGSIWKAYKNGIYPIDINTNNVCYDSSQTPLIWINTRTGDMHFNPTKLSDNASGDGFCERLRDSYAKDKNKGDKIIPLDISKVD